uniref:Uncharacterized protein n=3 Tax=unclassified bacterial viruses TaxID=12333 RepID=A0AAU6VZJ6_9VIRU
MVKTFHCTTLFKAIRLAWKLEGRIVRLNKGWGVRVGPRTVTPLPLVQVVLVPTIYGFRHEVVFNTGDTNG